MTRRSSAALAAMLFAISTGAACSGGSHQSPTVVTLQTDQDVAALFPSWIAWLSAAQDGQPQAVLARDGDFVMTSKGVFRYDASDGTALKLTMDDSFIRIGEKVVTVLDDDAGRHWLETATNQQLSDLRVVGVGDKLDAPQVAALKRLASVNARLALLCESDDAVAQALPLFKPQALFLGDDVGAPSIRLLANQPNIETLLVSDAGKAENLDALATLPKLRRLAIGKMKGQAAKLPAGLKALKGLVLFDNDMKDLSSLAAVPASLEELSLLGLRDLSDVSAVSRFTDLQTLVLAGDEHLRDISALGSLKQLRRAGLPPKLGQDQFAAFVAAHPDLAILELMDTDEITSLAPVRTLKHLEGIVVGGSRKNVSDLQGLTSLRFVGVSKNQFDDSPAEIAALRKSLPDAVVVRVKPLCLGSGWLLLLVPVFGAGWLRRRRLQHAGPTA